jgi:hypothetical protein
MIGRLHDGGSLGRGGAKARRAIAAGPLHRKKHIKESLCQIIMAGVRSGLVKWSWIPAFAGMTIFERLAPKIRDQVR